MATSKPKVVTRLSLFFGFEISRAANNGVAIHLVSKWAGHSELKTTMKYLHVNEDYEWIEMQKMLSNEAANEKVVALDEYRKVGGLV